MPRTFDFRLVRGPDRTTALALHRADQVDGCRGRMRLAWPGARRESRWGAGRMNAAMEANRELLWPLLRRRGEELPTVALCAVAAAADELVDPLVLPTLMAVDHDVVEDVPGVLRAGPANRSRSTTRACWPFLRAVDR